MNEIYLLPTNINAYDFVKQKFNIEDFEILKTDNGKPYIKTCHSLYFNVSHSKDLQAVAISDSEVGVDIEFIRKVDLRAVKRFTKAEEEYILSENSLERFFEVWTKKEAYLKYNGVGLSGGLNSFNVFEVSPYIKTFKIDQYFLSVCGERDFKIIKAFG